MRRAAAGAGGIRGRGCCRHRAARATPYSVMKPVDQPARRDVEGGVVDRRRRRRCALLRPSALRSGSASPESKREVERRARCRDVERDAVVRRRDRDAVGADLVGRVAVARDAVGADDDRAHRFALHRDRGRAVDDQRAGHAGFAQLEHREPRALQQRARLVDEDVQRLAGAVRGDEDSPAPCRRRRSRSGPVLQCVSTLPSAGKSATDASAIRRSTSRCSSWMRCASSSSLAGARPARDRPPRPGSRPSAARRESAPRPPRSAARSPAWSRAASATPYAPKIPIAGAPRTASVRIASTTSSTVVARSRTTARGSAR